MLFMVPPEAVCRCAVERLLPRGKEQCASGVNRSRQLCPAQPEGPVSRRAGIDPCTIGALPVCGVEPPQRNPSPSAPIVAPFLNLRLFCREYLRDLRKWDFLRGNHGVGELFAF